MTTTHDDGLPLVEDLTGQPARFRHSGAILAAGIIGLVSTTPLATLSWLFAPLLLIPIAVIVYAWRTGTDADATGLTVRAAIGRRQIPWSAIAGVGPNGRGGTMASLTGGGCVTLPAVRVIDLPRLVLASGQRVELTADADS